MPGRIGTGWWLFSAHFGLPTRITTTRGANEQKACANLVDLTQQSLDARARTASVSPRLIDVMTTLSLGAVVLEAEAKLKAAQDAVAAVLKAAQETESNLRNDLAAAQKQRDNPAASCGTIGSGPYWQSASDPRSAWAGQARAALLLERSNP